MKRFWWGMNYILVVYLYDPRHTDISEVGRSLQIIWYITIYYILIVGFQLLPTTPRPPPPEDVYVLYQGKLGTRVPPQSRSARPREASSPSGIGITSFYKYFCLKHVLSNKLIKIWVNILFLKAKVYLLSLQLGQDYFVYTLKKNLEFTGLENIW